MKRGALRVAQIVLALAVLALAGRQLWKQWTDVSQADAHFQFYWLAFLGACAIVFAAYLLLIETWRRVLGQLGAPVPFLPAARIWFASNLGKYIPGKVWTVTGMVVLIGREGVPAPAATASAVVLTIAQVASGFAVVLFTGLDAVKELTGGTTGVVVATIGMVASLVLAPLIAGQWNRFAVRIGREQLGVSVPVSATLIALAGCLVSWFAYGLAFQLLVHSLTGMTGPYKSYTAAYASSYLFGFLMLFAPGGLGARELALTSVLPVLGLATQAQAAVITVASRLWLTMVELVPSLIALARTTTKNR